MDKTEQTSPNSICMKQQNRFTMIALVGLSVCGFSFVSGWIEQYEQANKETLQKSKALRRGLFSSSVTLQILQIKYNKMCK